MSEITYKTIFKFRRASKEQWENVNPVLREGEPGFEIDTGKLKIGNGILPWKDLIYINNDSIKISTDNKSIIIDGVGEISLNGFNNALIGQSIRKSKDGTLEWYTPTDENAISNISINNEILPIENKEVKIPLGTNETFGVIKGSNQINNISINEKGICSLNSLEVDRLENKPGFSLILNSGDSTI